jgi:hypothetical protein
MMQCMVPELFRIGSCKLKGGLEQHGVCMCTRMSHFQV